MPEHREGENMEASDELIASGLLARQFADMYRSGAQGAEMDYETARFLALSIDALARIPDMGEPVAGEPRQADGPEPVAWLHKNARFGREVTFAKDIAGLEEHRGWVKTPLYAAHTHPVPSDTPAVAGEPSATAPHSWLDSNMRMLATALEPFALIAEADIGMDEADDDIFRPISEPRNALAPRLKVGDFRRARLAYEAAQRARK